MNDNEEYIAMQFVGKSLKHLIKSRRNVFSSKSVCQMGIALVNLVPFNSIQLNRLEKLHDLGFLHLDIKPDNILIEDSSNPETGQTQSTVYLIDFGVSSSYLCSDRLTHVKMNLNEPFNGNLIFCSKNMFLEISKTPPLN